MRFHIRPRGQCMGRLLAHHEMLVDTDAPIVSGDLVVIELTHRGRLARLVKLLETTRTGKWFGQCMESTIDLALIRPTAVYKVLSTRRLPGLPPIHAPLDEADAPTEKTFAVLDAASVEARIEWSRFGKAIGVPFRRPQDRYEPPSTIDGTIEPPHAGMLRFTLEEPLVRPMGTQYQILRSVSTLANPTSTSVTTVIWQGLASEANLPADARSLYWYHTRAIANSYTSPLMPNTFGVGARPWIPPESVPGNRAFPDGEFAFASNSCWTWVDSGAAIGVPSSRAFFPSSGFTNQRGYMRLTISSHNNGLGQTYVMPARFDVNSRFSTNAAPMLPGQRGSAYFSVRGTGSSSLPNITLGVYGCRVESPGTLPQLSLLTLANTTVDHRSIGSGTWVTYSSTFTMANSFYDGAVMAITFPPAYGGPAATIDIGAAQLTTF